MFQVACTLLNIYSRLIISCYILVKMSIVVTCTCDTDHCDVDNVCKVCIVELCIWYVMHVS